MPRGDGERDAWYEALFDFLGKWYVWGTIVMLGVYLWKGPQVVEFFVRMIERIVGAVGP